MLPRRYTVVAALLAAFAALPASAATYYVSTSGNDSTGNGSSGSPWRSIQRAVRSDSPVAGGDLILVQPGTYTESIELQKSGSSDSSRITLRGNGSLGQIIIKDPTPRDGWWQTGVIMAARKSNWNIENLRVEDSSWAGITLRSCSNITVRNCYTWRTGSSGIIALPYWDNNGGPNGEAEVNSSNIKVLDCTVESANWLEDDATYTNRSGDQESLTLWGVNGFEIARNKVFNGKTEGIDIKTGTRNGTIHHNQVWGCAAVTGLQGGTGTGRRNGGPAIYLDGGRANVFNVQVYNNLVRDNKAEGIAVADEDTLGSIYDIKIYNNVTHGNGIQGVNSGSGINIAAGLRIDVYHNTSVGDVSGITIDGGAFGAPLPDDIELRNNLVSAAKYKTVRILDSRNVLFDRNLYTTNISPAIDNAGNNTNLNITGTNLAVASAFLTSTWRLTTSSAALNAATTVNGLSPSFDFDDQSRPQSGIPDIGADEISGSGTADIVVETADPAANKSSDTHRLFSESAASGGSATVLEGNAVGDYATYAIPGVQARTYKIFVRYKDGSNRATVQMLGGASATTGFSNYGSAWDMYGGAGYVEREVATITFGSATTKYLRFQATGKNGSSSSYWIAVDRLRLVAQ